MLPQIDRRTRIEKDGRIGYRMMTVADGEHHILYRAANGAGYPEGEHDLVLEMEIDDDWRKKLKDGTVLSREGLGWVTLNIYQDLNWACWHFGNSWWGRFRNRLRALRAIIRGKLEVSTVFEFTDERQILQFISALRCGLRRMKAQAHRMEKRAAAERLGTRRMGEYL